MRILLLLAMLTWLACGDAPAREVRAANAPEPVRAVEPLPALERARLSYLFEAMRNVERAWPWPAGQRLCVLLLAPDRQWAVNCPEPPSNAFQRAPEAFADQPVFARAGGRFVRAGRELATSELLHVMPAAAHVDEPGKRGSDLPAKYPWLLLGTLEGLRKHHPAFEDASTEEWISVALHEFAHTRQLLLPSFADELSRINRGAADPSRLGALYHADAEYRRLVEAEYTQLVAAAWEPPSAGEARRALATWLAAYQRRVALLRAKPDGAELARSDALFTYVEGVARYVESQYLVDAVQHPRAPVPNDPRARGYARFAGLGYAGMPNKQLDPEYYYAIGFHLCVLLERAAPGWRERVHEAPSYVIGAVERSLLRP
ncbi:MAG TPA: hypothetical protein VJR89_24240 [Polyangiales bacterium]|nr:hypothetical protein [Polyangiales bacterium]